MAEFQSKRAPAGAGPTSADKPAFIERRRSIRYAFSVAAEVTEAQTKARIIGRSADLGMGGCYVDTINPFPQGTAVHLRLMDTGRTFDSQAVVVFAVVGMGMGLAFVNVAPDQRLVLQGWVSELSGASAPSLESSEPDIAEQQSQECVRHVLNQLISLLVRKRLLTEKEGTALLRELFR